MREHRVHIKATPEWRIGLMTPTEQCPEMTIWTNTPSVWNWTGSVWEEEQLPAASYGTEEQIFEDALPTAPVPSAWADVADFDQSFWVENITNPQYFWTYGYDYILDPNDLTPDTASVVIWTLKDRNTGDTTECTPKHYFQQREIYTYESVAGYPKGVLTTETIADTPDFITTAYTLTDNDSGADITPVSGWYLIPAGHSVTIEKTVTTPELTFYSDDISNVENFPSYTANRHDKAITWSVARHLGITLVHDAGEANIALMPQRNISVGNGAITYQISR